MAVLSAVPALVAAVQAYFDANDVSANVVFGVRELTKQINQGPNGANRVVFSPDPNGDGGTILPPRLKASGGQAGSPRPIVTWEKLLIVSIWAVDTSDKDNELLQFVAVENLFESTVQAVRSYAHADITWGSPKWTTSPVELLFGKEIRVPLRFRGALFSLPNDVRNPTPVVNRDPQ